MSIYYITTGQGILLNIFTKLPLKALWSGAHGGVFKVKCSGVLILVVDGSEDQEEWRRFCNTVSEDSLGCHEIYPSSGVVVRDCVCDTDLCNDYMDPIPTETTSAETTSNSNSNPYVYSI